MSSTHSYNFTVEAGTQDEVQTIEIPGGGKVTVKTQGSTPEVVQSQLSRIHIEGTQPAESHVHHDRVEVTKGEDGKSNIRVGDDNFGFNISCNLDNTNVVVNTDGEKQVISSGDGGQISIEKDDSPTHSVQWEVHQRSRGGKVVPTLAVGKELASGDGYCKETVKQFTDENGNEVTETTIVEVLEENGSHTERTTVLTQTKTPRGMRMHRSFSSKTVGPSYGGGITRIRARMVPQEEHPPVNAVNVKVTENVAQPQEAPSKEPENIVQTNTTYQVPTSPTVQTGTDAASGNIEKLLKWIKKRIDQYQAVNITNFTTSWEDGKALCALMNYLLGEEKLNSADVSATDKLHNFTLAIDAATAAGVPPLLDPNELATHGIDRRSMITYLHLVYQKLYADKKQAEKK